MANGAAAGGIVGAVSSAISALTPGQVQLLGGHLTNSNEAKALQYLFSMQTTPAAAGTFLALLGSIPNLPQQVLTFASTAVAAGPGPVFTQNIAEAQAALQQSLASENAIQQAFGI